MTEAVLRNLNAKAESDAINERVNGKLESDLCGRHIRAVVQEIGKRKNTGSSHGESQF
jgi:hypothetical protein